jgi:hypothetical protein
MGITVRTHVARDLLQSAAYFNSIPKVVWEYVSNAIDNPRQGEAVTVVVDIRQERIVIEDTARGMSREGLQQFFQMHGENLARRQGRAVRGRFGTGKSAAFGIANHLVVETVQNGLLNVVSLDRGDIERANDGDPFQVREHVIDEPTEREAGTKVVISHINVRQLEVDRTRKYIQQHLRRQHQSHEVIVNRRLCQPEEIPFVREMAFQTPTEARENLGDAVLTLRVSPEPLDSDDVGVHIFSRGIWHESTLGDQTGKQYTDYIFGEVDVPALEEDTGPVPPFDNTRSNQLNRANATVIQLLAWISRSIESVRRDLAQEERARRDTELAKELEGQAERIADLLNEDFRDWAREEARLRLTANAVDAGVAVPHTVPDETVTELLPNGLAPMPEALEPGGIRLPPGTGKEPTPKKGRAPSGTDQPTESGERGTASNAEGGGVPTKRRARSGFSIQFRNMTDAAFRSRYVPATRTILINLDHPLLRAALATEGGVGGKSFQQLSYEVGATEYAFALGFEVATREGESYDPFLALNDALRSVDRVSRLLSRVLA